MTFFPRLRQMSLPAQVELDGESGTVRVKLRKNPRAVRYTLRIAAGGREPVLTIPARGTFEAACTFLEHNRRWLEERLRAEPSPRELRPGRFVPLRGVEHRIAHRPKERGTVRREPGEPPVLAVMGEREHLRRRLIDFLKREARRDLEKSVAKYAELLRVRPTGIKMRDTTSRWGSCSANGKLSFSWRLVLAPPMVLDYLAAHEVAHLKEMNHSDRFWRIVERVCPHHAVAQAWLKRHGRSLFGVGAEEIDEEEEPLSFLLAGHKRD
jgi:predicted metal-dependent hydrolase